MIAERETRMSQPTELFDLTGKVAIVTGFDQGPRPRHGRGPVGGGAAVVVSSRKQDLCDEVAEEVGAATGGEVLALACHVGDWDAIPGFVDAVVERFGTIDVLVNNAGINPAPVKVADMPLELWRKIFTVNLEGPLRMSQCVAPVMRDNGVAASSTSGRWAPTTRIGHRRLRRLEGGPQEPHRDHGRRLGAVEGARQHAQPGPFMSEMVREPTAPSRASSRCWRRPTR